MNKHKKIIKILLTILILQILLPMINVIFENKISIISNANNINKEEINNLKGEEFISLIEGLMTERKYNEYAIKVIKTLIPDYKKLLNNDEIYSLFYKVKCVTLNPYDPQNPNLSKDNRAYNAGGNIVVNCFENELENDSNWDGLRWLLTHEIMHSLGEFSNTYNKILDTSVSVNIRNRLLEEGLADSIAYLVKQTNHNTSFAIIKQKEFKMYAIENNGKEDLNRVINHTYILSGNVINLFKYIGCYDELIHANIDNDFNKLKKSMGEKVINGEKYFDKLFELLNTMYLYMEYPNTFKSHETVIKKYKTNENIIGIIEDNNLNDLLIKYAKLSAEIINKKIDNTYDIADFKKNNLILYSEDGINFKTNADWVEKVLTEIAVKKYPKTDYIRGEKLDLTGGIIKVKYEDGNTEEIAMNDSEVTISGYNKNTLGEQTITASYKGKTASFTITVENEINGILIKDTPRVEYIKGEELDLTGGIIKVKYEDGNTEEIAMNDSEVTISGYNKNTLGEQTITVSYKGKKSTFKIEVKEKELIYVKIVVPSKLKYIKGEKLDLTGLKITEIYNDGTNEQVIQGYNIVGYIPNKVGKQTLTIEYKNYKKSFDIEVVEEIIESNPSEDKGNKEENKNESTEKSIETVLIIPPSKVRYKQGEELDLTGLNITVIYSNNTIEKIEGKNLVKGYNKNKLGEQTLSINYKGYKRDYEIKVLSEITASDRLENEETEENNNVNNDNKEPITDNESNNNLETVEKTLKIKEILIGVVILSLTILVFVFLKQKKSNEN